MSGGLQVLVSSIMMGGSEKVISSFMKMVHTLVALEMRMLQRPSREAT